MRSISVTPLLQKTYTVDFLSKKRVINDGIVPQYYVENSYEPIISREIFRQVQDELARSRACRTKFLELRNCIYR